MVLERHELVVVRDAASQTTGQEENGVLRHSKREGQRWVLMSYTAVAQAMFPEK